MKLSKTQSYAVSLTLITLLISFVSVYAIHDEPHVVHGEYFGIDISKWNHNTDLSNHDLDFVIIRLGYTGSTEKSFMLDEYFYQNIEQCINLNIPFGVYYYSLATSPYESFKEAEFILETLGTTKPPLGIFLDIEDETFQSNLSKDTLTSIAKQFQTTIEISNNIAGIYANTYWWNTKIDYTQLDGCILWVANYNEGYTLESPFMIHQYTDQGRLENENTNFDFNITNKKYW